MTTDPVLGAIERDIQNDSGTLGRLRSLRTSWRALAVATVWLAIPVLAWATWLRVDYPEYPKGRLMAQLLLIAAAGAITLIVSMRPLQKPPLPRGMVWTVLGLSVILAVTLAALPVAHQAHPESLKGVGDDFAHRALACFTLGTVWSAIPMATLILFKRSIGSTLPLFALSSLCGVAGLVIHCPLVAREHIFAGHTAVVLAALALSAAATWARRR
jgi:hypothetical protein